MTRRTTSIHFHKPYYTERQAQMMLWLNRSDSTCSADAMRHLWGPRFRIILHPLFDAGVVDTGTVFSTDSTIYYHLTPEGMDDVEILRTRMDPQ
jgi:hypothetical protein